jgi:hypothetical protein
MNANLINILNCQKPNMADDPQWGNIGQEAIGERPLPPPGRYSIGEWYVPAMRAIGC